MRVVYFSQGYTAHDRRFLQALAGTPHEVLFLQLEADRSRPIQPALPEGIRRIDWWGGRRPVGWADFPRARVEVGKVLREVRPDLVHAGPVQRPAFLTAAAGFRPLVTMSWGSDILRDGRGGWGRALARYTLRRSSVLVCDCQAVRVAAAGLGMSPSRTVVFPWGVDLNHFRPRPGDGLRARLGWENAFVLLSTRAWEPLYGIDLLADAFVRSARRVPDVRLVMLGAGSLESSVLQTFRQAKVEDKVYRAGPVDLGDLPDYYGAADLYLSASRSDGSSVSLLEALASGLPAIVSDIPGNREWIEPEVEGWLFADGNAEDLAEKIVRAAGHRDELPAMGKRGRSLAEARADWSSNFPKLLRAYAMAAPGLG